MGRTKEAFHPGVWGYALILMREMPVSNACDRFSVSEQRLWRMPFVHVDAARAELSLKDVVWIRANEMNRRIGPHYVTVFADLVSRRVVYATGGRDAKASERSATELLNHNDHPKAVAEVAIDMSAAYAKGVRENFGDAKVVYDKFDLVQARGRSVRPGPGGRDAIETRATGQALQDTEGHSCDSASASDNPRYSDVGSGVMAGSGLPSRALAM